VHCYPECIAEVVRREADVKWSMGVVPLFTLLLASEQLNILQFVSQLLFIIVSVSVVIF